MPRRVPMNVHPKVREILGNVLLGAMDGTGVGYSAVVHAAAMLLKEKGKDGERFRAFCEQSQIAVTIYDARDEKEATDGRS